MRNSSEYELESMINTMMVAGMCVDDEDQDQSSSQISEQYVEEDEEWAFIDTRENPQGRSEFRQIRNDERISKDIYQQNLVFEFTQKWELSADDAFEILEQIGFTDNIHHTLRKLEQLMATYDLSGEELWTIMHIRKWLDIECQFRISWDHLAYLLDELPSVYQLDDLKRKFRLLLSRISSRFQYIGERDLALFFVEEWETPGLSWRLCS